MPSSMTIIIYNLDVNGQSTGTYYLNTLQQIIVAGHFFASSLDWKAETVNELKSMFVVEASVQQEN